MTNDPAGLVVVVGFVVAAVGSVPLAAVSFALARGGRRFSRAVVTAGVGLGTLAIGGTAVVAASVTAGAGLVVVTVGALLGLVLWAVPLVVARRLLVGRGVDPERALREATLGLPVAMLASLAIAFGDFGRYNITFLTGIEAVVAWSALAVVVLLGPAAVGFAIERSRA